MSSVRCFLGERVDFEEFQRKIIENWKDEIPDKNVLLKDATCYEVYIRFPTDVKASLGSLRMVVGKANSSDL